jgi:hypothetical protein
MKTTHHSILFENTEDYHVWLNVQIDWAQPEVPGVVCVTDEWGGELAYFDWEDNDQSREAQAVYDAYDEGKI